MLHSLGSAHGLFRGAVESIVLQQYSWFDDASLIQKTEGRKYGEASSMVKIASFFQLFSAVSPNMVTYDSMKNLIHQAHQTLLQMQPQMARWTPTGLFDSLALYFGQVWSMVAKVSQEQRWEISSVHIATKGVKDPRRKSITASNRQNKGLEEVEFCANCFRVDKDLGVKFLKCSRCGLFAYCGKNCQASHWKKGGHKTKCQPEEL